MSTFGLRLASALACRWVRVYTCGLPSEHAERRCAEIESDLWELQRDADRGRVLTPAVQVIARLVLGAAHDVRWRLEQVSVADSVTLRRMLAGTGAAVCVLAMLWIWPLRHDSGAGGRASVAGCAQSVASPESTAEFRLQVVSCAGAFFSRRSDSSEPTRD